MRDVRRKVGAGQTLVVWSYRDNLSKKKRRGVKSRAIVIRYRANYWR